MPPTVSILGQSCLLNGGRPAKAHAVMGPDPVRGLVVANIVVDDPGVGYICTPTITVVDSPKEIAQRTSGFSPGEANCTAIAVLTVGAIEASFVLRHARDS